MKISVGMLAYNEAERIESALRSTFAQTLFTRPPAGVTSLELIVVPNGCKDDTAKIARATIERMLAEFKAVAHTVRARVEELPEPGKSNAWNRYVHDFADAGADYVFLLDSDITLNHERCLSLLLETLMAQPDAYCCVGRPLKDIALKENKSLFDRLSLAGSDLSKDGPATIAGSMYVIRGQVIRRIWMPKGLLVEDGFLRAMLITNFFKAKDEYHRVVREERASQIFEAVRSPWGIFKHSRRLMVGARINACIYDRLWNLPDGVDAGSYARDMEAQDPQWLRALVRERTSGKGWWVMQRGLVLKRFRALKNKPPVRALLALPVAIAAFPFETAVLISANRAVRRGEFRW